MKRFRMRLFASLFIVGGFNQFAHAAPPPAVNDILAFKPRIGGVEITIPAGAQLSACKVEAAKKGDSVIGWILTDGNGNTLRKFVDASGSGQINTWSYFRDGVEAYREIDSNNNNRVDQYRWLGKNGSKWGVDVDEDGKIDSWLAISPEEVSQEILAAIGTRDFERVKALMLTQKDVETLGLPPAELSRLNEKMAAAGADFQKTCAALVNVDDKAVWLHLETRKPETLAADELGSKIDLIRYPHATILAQVGNGTDTKTQNIQTGELIQVGRAWRIVQAPYGGLPEEAVASNNIGGVRIPAGAEKFIEELKTHDTNAAPADRAQLTDYHLKRAAILEKIVALIKPDDRANRDVWVRQVAESYAAAAQQLDGTALQKLDGLRQQLEKTNDPESVKLLAYVTFRTLTANYAIRLAQFASQKEPNPQDMQKLQDDWKATLTKFVSDFGTADDTPDAMMQLGMVYEFAGKEDEAKKWYELLIKNFDRHPLARKAQGCLTRMNLEGKQLELVGKTLAGNQSFDVKALAGKVVVVYYWASWNGTAMDDFKKIRIAMAQYKNVELVGVNLDNNPASAIDFLKQNEIGNGVHIHETGGLESGLATQYGITVLPNIFITNAQGIVVDRSAQATTLIDDLKKAGAK
ncbi:MAG: thioredoxin-like domain-containing protein [Zavarzinella sp.]